MAFQMRVTATCRLVNRWTGSTPGRLFQISTRRAPGHFAASAPSSCGLLNVSLSSALSSVGSEPAWTAMSLSLSIVKVAMDSSSCRDFTTDHIHGSGGRDRQGNSAAVYQVPVPTMDLTVSPDRGRNVHWKRRDPAGGNQPLEGEGIRNRNSCTCEHAW